MKKLLAISAAAIVLPLTAAEKKNIPYYEANWPKTGNTEYLKIRCVLDLRLPDKQKKFPTLIFFHGGGIAHGSKHCPPHINREKIAVAAVNYRLSGDKAQAPDYLYDAAAATAWVLKHIAEYGGDPKQVYVTGHSAGGYLSAMIALDAKYLKAFGAAPEQLAAVMPVSGQMTTHFQILNERRKKAPDTPDIMLDEYAPIFHARKNAPPMMLFAGDSNIEWPGRVEENLLLAARLKRNFKNSNAVCYTIPNCNHGTVLGPSLIMINQYILDKLKSFER